MRSRVSALFCVLKLISKPAQRKRPILSPSKDHPEIVIVRSIRATNPSRSSASVAHHEISSQEYGLVDSHVPMVKILKRARLIGLENAFALCARASAISPHRPSLCPFMHLFMKRQEVANSVENMLFAPRLSFCVSNIFCSSQSQAMELGGFRSQSSVRRISEKWLCSMFLSEISTAAITSVRTELSRMVLGELFF